MTLQGREDDGYTLSGKLLVTRNGGWCVCSVLTRGQVHQQVVANELDDVTSPSLGDGVTWLADVAEAGPELLDVEVSRLEDGVLW